MRKYPIEAMQSAPMTHHCKPPHSKSHLVLPAEKITSIPPLSPIRTIAREKVLVYISRSLTDHSQEPDINPRPSTLCAATCRTCSRGKGNQEVQLPLPPPREGSQSACHCKSAAPRLWLAAGARSSPSCLLACACRRSILPSVFRTWWVFTVS